VPTNGFLVAPVKSPGPQPILVQNLSHHPQTFTLTPVATQMQGKFCAPTNTPVTWFSVAHTVTVPARKTVKLPVHVSGDHGVVDVAVKVQAGGNQSVALASYAQEIIGRGQGTGCAHIRGRADPAPASHGLPLLPLAIILVAVIALAATFTLGRRSKGAHR
jgi:hypothetical protein